MRQHLQKADVIWANSQFTRRDFLEYFPAVPEDKVHVALHGGGDHFRPSSPEQTASSLAMKTIASLPKSVTVAIIAHRLSTVEWCDALLWLKDGEIAMAVAHSGAGIFVPTDSLLARRYQ